MSVPCMSPYVSLLPHDVQHCSDISHIMIVWVPGFSSPSQLFASGRIAEGELHRDLSLDRARSCPRSLMTLEERQQSEEREGLRWPVLGGLSCHTPAGNAQTLANPHRQMRLESPSPAHHCIWELIENQEQPWCRYVVRFMSNSAMHENDCHRPGVSSFRGGTLQELHWR